MSETVNPDGLNWTSDEAKQLFEHLREDCRKIGETIGVIAPDVPERVTATEMLQRRHAYYHAAKSQETWAKAQSDYAEATKPIVAEMTRLVSLFTKPAPIFVEVGKTTTESPDTP